MVSLPSPRLVLARGDGGVHACPFLAGRPGARLTEGTLKESFADAPLYHPACVMCVQTGMTCKNG